MVGVDTHEHLHVAVARDDLGSRVGDCTVSAEWAGHADLEAWRDHGRR